MNSTEILLKIEEKLDVYHEIKSTNLRKIEKEKNISLKNRFFLITDNNETEELSAILNIDNKERDILRKSDVIVFDSLNCNCFIFCFEKDGAIWYKSKERKKIGKVKLGKTNAFLEKFCEDDVLGVVKNLIQSFVDILVFKKSIKDISFYIDVLSWFEKDVMNELDSLNLESGLLHKYEVQNSMEEIGAELNKIEESLKNKILNLKNNFKLIEKINFN